MSALHETRGREPRSLTVAGVNVRRSDSREVDTDQDEFEYEAASLSDFGRGSASDASRSCSPLPPSSVGRMGRRPVRERAVPRWPLRETEQVKVAPATPLQQLKHRLGPLLARPQAAQPLSAALLVAQSVAAPAQRRLGRGRRDERALRTGAPDRFEPRRGLDRAPGPVAPREKLLTQPRGPQFRSGSSGCVRRAAVERGRRRPSSLERRGPRARRAEITTLRSEPSEYNCYAWCLSDQINLEKLQDSWSDSMRARAAQLAASARAGIPPPASASQVPIPVVPLNKEIRLLKVGRKDCFVFNFGCLVCWGCKAEEATRAKDALTGFLVRPLEARDVDEDTVVLGGRGSDIKPELQLSSQNPPTLERVPVAYALAQSVRLGSLEARVSHYIEKTRWIPESLAKTGHVNLSQRKVTQMIGELWVLRNEVNLHTDILDTPDFFWEYSAYEPLYISCREHLDIDRRVEILNQRFEVLQDLFDVFQNELNVVNEDRLEWMVIVLLALEAFVMALRLYARYRKGLYSPDMPGPHARPMQILPILGPVGFVCHHAMVTPGKAVFLWLSRLAPTFV